MEGAISVLLKRFLLENVESYEQLHALLYLAGKRELPLSASDVSAALGISEDAALEALRSLQGHGVVVAMVSPQRSLFRLESRPDIDAMLEELRHVHEQRPVDMAKLMTASAIERARTLTARHFADAFLLRKDKKDHG
jgi:DNA-binding transcriptional regulator GbsR (MarR family)